MKKTTPPLLFLCLLLLFSCKQKTDSSTNSSQKKVRKPNLLIVVADQYSYDMLGADGNDQVITPNLDAFANKGVRFDHAFSNQPVCTPFRGMLMSGMQPLKNGAFVNDVPLLPNKTKLLGQVLKENGYQTAYFGKWHLLGGDRDRPIPKGKLRYGFDKLWTNNCKVDCRPQKAFYWNDQGKKTYFDKWSVYGQTDQALTYIDTVNKSKPFAVIVSWHPPHDWGKFKGIDGKMHYRYDTMEDLMRMYNRDSIKMRPGLKNTPDRRHMYHGYMARVSGVDKAFGELTDRLDALGLTDNTLTIFTADHGDMLESHHAVIAKQYPHDYSIHVPLLMRYPKKLKGGTHTDLMIGSLNLMPSILGLLDIETDQKYDGKDLSKAIENGKEDVMDYIPLWLYRRGVAPNNNWRGVVTKNYTFAMGRGKDSIPLVNVLYDRKNDPNQLHNLFHDPKYRSQRDSLEALTKKWMKKYYDRFYSAKDFKSVRPKKTWMYDYTHSPYELFKEKYTTN